MAKDMMSMSPEEIIEMGYRERQERIGNMAMLFIKEAMCQMLYGLDIRSSRDVRKNPDVCDMDNLLNFYGHITDVVMDTVVHKKMDAMDLIDVTYAIADILFNRDGSGVTPRDRENALLSGMVIRSSEKEVSEMSFEDFHNYISTNVVEDPSAS